jgi:RNA polymerase sigma-70 factor (ECF subfamily)
MDRTGVTRIEALSQTDEGRAAPGAAPGEAALDQASARAAAFRRLADSHLTEAYRLARLILRDGSEAEDAVHDAFVRAWKAWPTLRDQERFVPWFDRIVVNTCRNRLRSWRRWHGSGAVDEFHPDPSDAHLATLDRDLIGPYFGQLGADDRIVLALRYYRDLQVDEIARMLGVRPGTVKSRIHRALGRLRTILRVHGIEGADG